MIPLPRAAWCLFACTVLLTPVGRGAPARVPEIELITDTEWLQPAATLEFRFARPMIAREEVGSVAPVLPVVMAPEIPGKFTWLSQRSGVFVPAHAPPLGRGLQITARPGLVAADGQPIGGKFQAKLQTPPFKITALNQDAATDDLPAEPVIKMAFNLTIDLASAQAAARFVNDEGTVVPATVRYATARDYFQVAAENGDWEERWEQALNPAAGPPKGDAPNDDENDGDESEENPDTAAAELPPRANVLVLTPAQPLLPGSAWRLELAAGLKARLPGYALPNLVAIPLGHVTAFAVKSLRTASYLNSGRSLDVEFTQELAPDINDETLPKFFRVEPAVPHLRFEPGWRALVLRGDFELGKIYRLVIGDDVISDGGLPFTGERTRAFEFSPVKPRLYLPAITTHQASGSSRKLEVVSANLHSLAVTVRLVDPDHAADAIEAFEKYRAPTEEESDEIFQPLAPDAFPSDPIAERSIPLPAGPVDARQTTMIDWTEALGPRPNGVLFLTVEGEPRPELGGKRPAAQALVQLTDLGVLWKKIAGALRVTVFSMRTGQPLPAAQVSVLNPERVFHGRALTDAEGQATLPLAIEPGWLVVRLGNDTHALRLGNRAEDLPMAAFHFPIEYRDWETPAPSMPDVRAFLFTDRPLYRPGETVHVKGLLRGGPFARLQPFIGAQGALTLIDAQGRLLSATEVASDASGAFDADLVLPAEARGAHRLRLEIKQPAIAAHGDFSCAFEVADYQPNAFEVQVALPPRLTAKDQVAAVVTGKYLFGAPLTKATVRWTLRAGPQIFAPAGFANFHFGPETVPENLLTLRGEGALGGPTPFTAQPELPTPANAPMRGVFTAEVTDLNQQTVSETRSFTRDASRFYLGLAAEERQVIREGEPIVARAIAVAPDGQPLAQPVAVHAELTRLNFNTVRVAAAGHATSFRTETVEEKIAEADGETELPKWHDPAWELPPLAVTGAVVSLRSPVPVAAPGETARFRAGAAGKYRLRVTATDADGRQTVAENTILVSGPDEISWDYRNPAQIDLVPDHEEYRPGDTARILLKTPIAGDALISVEQGDRVLRSKRLKLEGNAPTIEIPLEADDGPNVFVSVVILRGSDASTRQFKTPEYRYGACLLRLAEPETRLQVEVAPATPEAEPGADFPTTIRVCDGLGAPMPDAEVTFFAVDDGVLAVTGYARPDPGAVFMQPFPLGVRTGLSLYELLPEDPAELEFANKGYLIGGGGSAGPGPKLRTDFPGTLCWMPKLSTDAAGLVRVHFKVPDALTRYRLVAVAHARDRFFGSGESSFAIRKPLMILPALGSFANVGDELVARAVVRNETGAKASITATLQLDATATSAQPGPATLTIPNGEARTVDFPIQITAPGAAAWTWTAHAENPTRSFDDAVVSKLTIGTPAPVLHETYLTDATAARTTDLLAGLNPQLLDGTGTAAVTISNTRLSSLAAAATELRAYPYGCAEQTVSALVPLAVQRDLGRYLPASENPHALIEKGLARLWTIQTESGGLGFWPGDQRAEVFTTAYAVIVLSRFEQTEAHLDAGGKMVAFLSAQLRGLAHEHADDRLADAALGLYALAVAGHAEPAYQEQLYRRRAALSFESRALLALAMERSGGDRKAIGELLNPKVTAPEELSPFGSAGRERAIQLLAWVHRDPHSKEVATLATELLALRVNGHWANTQADAWALLALADYAPAVEGHPQPVRATLFARGESTPFTLTPEAPSFARQFAITPGAPPEWHLENPQAAPLFAQTSFVVRPPAETQPRQDRGYAVSRRYQKLGDDGAPQPAENLRVGDRILVTLRVESARPGRFVAIDDPLPALLEPVNPSFTSRAVAGANSDAGAASSYREIRSDRVLIFCNELPPGAWSFSYLARVRAAGAATAPPAKVEEMYRPERFGLTETVRLTSVAGD